MPEEPVVRFFARSDPGMRRKVNEDAFTTDPAHAFCVLCDGMGGHASGEVASTMAVDLMSQRMREVLPRVDARRAEEVDGLRERLPRALLDAVKGANHAIFERGKIDPRIEQGRHMGTTLLVLCFLRDKAVLAHIGDSRIYRIRAGEIEMLTEDHSVLSPAAKSPEGKPRKRKYVTRALGTRARVVPELRSIDAEPGDFFLLCSDGLTDYVKDDELARFLTCVELEEVARIPRQLVALANQRGGRDNITVIIASVGDPSDGDELAPKASTTGEGTEPILSFDVAAETAPIEAPRILAPRADAPPPLEPPPPGARPHRELEDLELQPTPPPLDPPG